MRSTATLFIASVVLQPAVATLVDWNSASAFSCPANTDNSCNDQQKAGWDFSSLSLGSFSTYSSYSFEGFTCTDSQSKRDVLSKRSGFDGKCISGTASQTKGPSFSCSGSSDSHFSAEQYYVTVDRDVDVEFHYSMPDGSTCSHVTPCQSSGTVVQNTQCGGAQSVTFQLPSSETGGDCGINLHGINFDCSPAQSPSPKASASSSAPKSSEAAPAPSSQKPLPSSSAAGIPSFSIVVPSSSAPGSAPSSAPGVPSSAPGYGPSSVPNAPPSSAPGYGASSAPNVPSSAPYLPSSAPASGPKPSSVVGPASSSVNVPVYSSPAGQAPSSPAGQAPSSPAGQAPSYPAGQAPSSLAGPAASRPAGQKPSSPAGPAPSYPAGQKPSSPAGPAPSYPAGQAPSSPAGQAPSSPAGPAASSPAGQAPSSPAGQAPSSPAGQAPSSPAAPAPSSPAGQAPSSLAGPAASSPAAPSSARSSPPAPTSTCPDVLPKCLSTWMFSTSCNGNSDKDCFCKDDKFIANIYQCLSSWGENGTEIQAAVTYLVGVCSAYIPSNPGIITNCPSSITIKPTAQPTATSAPQQPVTAITVSQTVSVPCTYTYGSSKGQTIPSSFTQSTIQTVVTVPQVAFTTAASGVALVPGPSAGATAGVGIGATGGSGVGATAGSGVGATAGAGVGASAGASSYYSTGAYPAATTLATGLSGNNVSATAVPLQFPGAAPRVVGSWVAASVAVVAGIVFSL